MGATMIAPFVGDTSRKLRDYQQDAYINTWRDWSNGINRTVIVHATGLGKTDTAVAIAITAVRMSKLPMLLAERSEPLDQFTKRVPEYADIPVGRIQANRNEMFAPILAGSVQTVRNHKRMAQLEAAKRKPDIIIVDETHHAMADSYWDILEWAGCFDAVNPCLLVGLTATLIRGDNQAFDPLYTSVADAKGMDWGIDHGWLVEPYGKTIKIRRSIDHIQRTKGDLAAGGVGEFVTEHADQIVRGWEREGENRTTLACVPTIASAIALTDAFTARGHAAELVIGSTPHDERADIYKRLANGDTRIMVNVGVALEAFDCPAISCILLCRMTENPGLYEQMVGRGLRPLWGPDGKWLVDPTGALVKPDCLVIDVVGITRKFSLVTLIDIRNAAAYANVPELGRGFGRQHVSRAPRAPRWWQRNKSTKLTPQKGILRRIFDSLFG